MYVGIYLNVNNFYPSKKITETPIGRLFDTHTHILTYINIYMYMYVYEYACLYSYLFIYIYLFFKFFIFLGSFPTDVQWSH